MKALASIPIDSNSRNNFILYTKRTIHEFEYITTKYYIQVKKL